MTSTVTPEAAGFLEIMAAEVILPADWDVSGLWLAQAQNLAQFMADHRRVMDVEAGALLAGIGGMMIVMATREREASAAAGAFLRGEGGHA